MTLQDAEPAPDAVEPEALSLRDELRQRIQASMAEPEAPEVAAAETAEAKAQRERDELGRFKAKEAAAPETAPEDEAGEKSEPNSGKRPERMAPPEGWPADAKLAWDKLPPAAQAALAEDLGAGRLRLAGEASDAARDPILATVRQYEDDARSVGVEPKQYVENTLAWARELARDPHTYLPKVAQALGVDLSQYAARPGFHDNSAQGQPPPELMRLQAHVQRLEQHIAQQQRAEEERMQASVNAEVAAFREEKGADGSPLRPFLADIPPAALSMRVELLRQQQPSLPLRDLLQRAYDAEVFAHPEIRKRELARQAAAQAKAEEDKRIAAAAKARTVSVRDSRTPAALATPSEKMSLRDELRERFRAAEQRI